jgi:hypothetical protein
VAAGWQPLLAPREVGLRRQSCLGGHCQAACSKPRPPLSTTGALQTLQLAPLVSSSRRRGSRSDGMSRSKLGRVTGSNAVAAGRICNRPRAAAGGETTSGGVRTSGMSRDDLRCSMNAAAA